MYVRNINSIIRISEEEYKDLIKAKRENDDKNEVIKKYKRMGIFIENPIEMIEHPDTDTLEFRANHLCRHLTLQVTQQCNLRCEYCAYSGIYKNRVHNNSYEKSINSVRAQITCPCSGNACRGCISMDISSNRADYNKMYPQHQNGQYKLYI